MIAGNLAVLIGGIQMLWNYQVKVYAKIKAICLISQQMLFMKSKS